MLCTSFFISHLKIVCWTKIFFKKFFIPKNLFFGILSRGSLFGWYDCISTKKAHRIKRLLNKFSIQICIFIKWCLYLTSKTHWVCLFCFSHGTRCAGEVSAARDNNICGVGVAYNSQVAGKITSYMDWLVTSLDGLFLRVLHTLWKSFAYKSIFKDIFIFFKDMEFKHTFDLKMTEKIVFGGKSTFKNMLLFIKTKVSNSGPVCS